MQGDKMLPRPAVDEQNFRVTTAANYEKMGLFRHVPLLLMRRISNDLWI